MIDGKHCGNNETTRKGPVFKNGVPSEVACTVDAEGISVTVDGKTVMEFTGSWDRLALGDFWKTPNPRSLFLGAQNSTVYQISRMELTPIAQKKSDLDKLYAKKLPGTYKMFCSEMPRVDSYWHFSGDGRALQDGKQVGTWNVADGKVVIAYSEKKFGLAVLEFRAGNILAGRNEHQDGTTFNWRLERATPNDMIAGCYLIRRWGSGFPSAEIEPRLFFLERNNDVTISTLLDVPEKSLPLKVKSKVGRWEWNGNGISIFPGDERVLLYRAGQFKQESNLLRAEVRYVDDKKQAQSREIGIRRVGPIPQAVGPEGAPRFTIGELLGSPDLFKKESDGKTFYLTGRIVKLDASRLELAFHAGELSRVMFGGRVEQSSVTITSKDNLKWTGLRMEEVVTIRCHPRWETNRIAFRDGELFLPAVAKEKQ